MADVIGVQLDTDTLVLTKGRDFRWKFQLTDNEGTPVDFPAGELFFELATDGPVTRWDFDINGALASIKVESEDVDKIANGTRWQLVWLPDGEAAGGDPLGLGKVKVQQ